MHLIRNPVKKAIELKRGGMESLISLIYQLLTAKCKNALLCMRRIKKFGESEGDLLKESAS